MPEVTLPQATIEKLSTLADGRYIKFRRPHDEPCYLILSAPKARTWTLILTSRACHEDNPALLASTLKHDYDEATISYLGTVQSGAELLDVFNENGPLYSMMREPRRRNNRQ